METCSSHADGQSPGQPGHVNPTKTSAQNTVARVALVKASHMAKLKVRDASPLALLRGIAK